MLMRLLRKWQPELVQTWMYHADLIGGLAAKLCRIPVCWGIRQSELSARHTKLTTRCVAYVCAIVSSWVPSRIISCSQCGVETHLALGYASCFTVVPNGLDASIWRPRPELRRPVRALLHLPEEAFVFAHAGRADPQKNHEGLALAFNDVCAKHPSAWLLLCGAGLETGASYLLDLPFTAEARQKVVELGPRDDLPDLWQGADAFVLSSFGEGFPNVVAEAMASGLPCVVTDAGDAAEIVGDTGFIVNRRDGIELSQAMLDILNMPATDRERLSIRARERIQKRFTLDIMAEGFRRVWDDCISRRGSPCAD